MTDPLSSLVQRLRIAREKVETQPNSAARLFGEAADAIEAMQHEALTLRNAAVNAAEERDRLRALLRQWELGCTGKHSSQVPCVAREALGPAQEVKP